MAETHERLRHTGGDRVHLDEDWSVDYWVTTLGVPREELIAAVQAVGDRVEDVADHLATQSAAGPSS